MSAILEQINTCISQLAAGKELAGDTLAHILQGLVAHEVAEGGPYAFTGTPDVEDNALVAHFLLLQGVVLPKLDAFLAGAPEGARGDAYAAWLALSESKATEQDTGVQFDEEEGRIMTQIRALIDTRLQQQPVAFQEAAREIVEHTIRGNPDKQMSLMALYVRRALGSRGEKYTDAHIAELGVANVLFWAAFIIYDDFWDEDEAAQPRFLPVANTFARHYVDYFAHLLGTETNFRTFFHQSMDKLDAANQWEMESCRLKREGSEVVVPDTLPEYGNYEIKFYPAIGHVLGPVALLVQEGYSLDSEEVQQLITYFKHYLIAMQLNDDAHDWKEDLERGHISTAVSALLPVWKAKHPGKNIDIEKDMQELEQLFWFEVLTPICESVLEHCTQSRAALESLTCLENLEPLEQYITRNEAVAQQALTAREQSESFLDVFRK